MDVRREDGAMTKTMWMLAGGALGAAWLGHRRAAPPPADEEEEMRRGQEVA